MMLGLSADKWTVIARSAKPGTWMFIEGYSEAAIMAAAWGNDLIVMHRRYVEGDIRGWQLVARMAGPQWKALQRRNRGIRS